MREPNAKYQETRFTFDKKLGLWVYLSYLAQPRTEWLHGIYFVVGFDEMDEATDGLALLVKPSTHRIKHVSHRPKRRKRFKVGSWLTNVALLVGYHPDRVFASVMIHTHNLLRRPRENLPNETKKAPFENAHAQHPRARVERTKARTHVNCSLLRR